MKHLKLGVALLAIAVIALALLASGQEENRITAAAIDSGMSISTEETCAEGFDNKTCVTRAYVQCNGNTYKMPQPTKKTITEKVYVEKTVEKEVCNKESGVEKSSPQNRIKNSEIHVTRHEVRISARDVFWREYVDSNSMDPLIDEGTTTLEIKPDSEEEIKTGDIISFNSERHDTTVVHRVVKIGDDANGTYFLTKGDNNADNDPDKVRFNQVIGMIVGILY